MTGNKPIHRDSVDYWRQVTSEFNARHPSPSEAIYERYLDLLEVRSGERVLDVGVGFGRLARSCIDRGATLHGIDIDPAMVAAARGETGLPAGRLCVADAAQTGFRPQSFSRVVCWAAFDELDQSRVLLEMSRILRSSGRLLLTGKNSRYLADDADAMEAEVAARSKNHPNHFTHFAEINWESFGFRVAFGRYFVRRGDFARDVSTATMPAEFYEYVVLLVKDDLAQWTPEDVPEIASTYSRTFVRSQEGRGRA